jgi:DNA-binding LacI/PurR family transcriptional regulator
MLSEENIIGGWDVLYSRLGRCLEEQASARGWRMMQLIARREQMVGVFEQLRESRACGLIVDTVSPEVLGAAASTGLPVVAVDAWCDEEGVDVVVQDNFHGGEQAGGHLVAQGRTRIAWFGPAMRSYHARARYGGAAAALAAAGTGFHSVVQGSFRSEQALKAALEMLSAPERPDAILALWRPQYVAVRDAARQLGLRIGSDLDLVGWCVEEAHAVDFLPLFEDGAAPAAITWSAARMAGTAMAALEARRREPRKPAVRTLVPTRLKGGLSTLDLGPRHGRQASTSDLRGAKDSQGPRSKAQGPDNRGGTS